MRDLLRAFPLSGTEWVVQNLLTGTECVVDVERMTATCKGAEYRGWCKHGDFALYRAKLYGGDRQTFEQFMEQFLKQYQPL